ncbi:unnamed protein product [Chrysoparadoxa australica]
MGEVEGFGSNYTLATDTNTFWLMINSVMIFLLQVGFAMLEVGSVSPKNTKAVLIKNIGDAALGATCWWLFGNAIAYGFSAGGFIGTSGFALKQPIQGDLSEGVGVVAMRLGLACLAGIRSYSISYVITGERLGLWFFQWAFAASSATIVSGAVAERVKVLSYVFCAAVLTSFIYPVVVHWAWSSQGWISPFREDDLLFGCGASDFAGSGVVHMVGGLAALIGAKFARPRAGRFNEDGTSNKLTQQSPALQTLGTLIMWCGWYAFNGGSSLTITGGRSEVAARAMVNTTLAAGAATMCMVVLVKSFYKKFDSSLVNNGILAGLVAITGSAPLVETEGAFLIGIIAGAIYLGASRLLLKLRIDDVVDATPVHLACGFWGLIAAGLFSQRDYYADVYADNTDPNRAARCAGIFYGGNGSLLAANLIFAICIIVWVGITTTLLFALITVVVGLRVPLAEEEYGMDKTHHERRNSSSSVALRKALHKTGLEGAPLTSSGAVRRTSFSQQSTSRVSSAKF